MQISDKELQVINQLEFDGHYELAEFLRSRLEGLKEEVERLTAENKLYHENLVAIHDEKTERHRTALEWYADKKNWIDNVPGFVDMSSAEFDAGKRANKALQGSE